MPSLNLLDRADIEIEHFSQFFLGDLLAFPLPAKIGAKNLNMEPVLSRGPKGRLTQIASFWYFTSCFRKGGGAAESKEEKAADYGQDAR